MPVLLDISESESEEEIVAVGPGTMRRKSPGEGRDWLNGQTPDAARDDLMAAGDGQSGNHSGNSNATTSANTPIPTTGGASSGAGTGGHSGSNKRARRR